jgi:hypothetical protein
MGDPVSATCGQCNTSFKFRPGRGKGRFCSRECWRAFEAAAKTYVACLHCSKLFLLQQHRVLEKKGRYCSRKCYLASRPFKPTIALEERFWEKVVKADGDGCWDWNGSKDGHGYGRIMSPREMGPRQPLLASRVSWEIHNGPIPEGMHVLHHCDQPSCCRPDHLFLGDQITNMADCAAKGRTTRGERSTNSKLTDAQAIKIREDFVERREPFAVIARRHGVSNGVIADLIRGRRRRWLGGDLTANNPDYAASVGAT